MNARQLKKAERKQKRFQETVLKDVQLESSIDPTNNVVICNAGQATGFTSETILLFAERYISRTDVLQCILPTGKSYCFLEFRDVDSATIFYINIHGIHHRRPDDFQGPLYLCFLKSVPSNSCVQSTSLPLGLTLIDNFITEDEEIVLLNYFNWEKNENERGTLKQREVKHYGYEFRYGTNDVDKKLPLKETIPDTCTFLWERIRNHGIALNSPPDQLTVNRYTPGQGIPPHVDTHSPFGPIILSLSLCSPVVMDWKHWSGKRTQVDIPNRSLLIMENESRYDWLHGIAARLWDPIKSQSGLEDKTCNIFNRRTRDTRISLTFRWTSNIRCHCDFPKLCDRQTYLLRDKLQESHVNNEDIIASTLEDIHVHQVYEDIATHFSKTRHKPWPKVVDFVNQLPPGSLLFDLGAGNGKNILMKNELFQIAVERSFGLLEICMEQCKKANSSDCLRGDVLSVPFKDSVADAILCIAVLHHFANKERRIKAISEMIRILRVGGFAFITVWARDQCGATYLKENKSDSVDSEDSIRNYDILPGLSLPVHENRTQFKRGDLLVPWKLEKSKQSGEAARSDLVLLRYYHVFEKGELDELCSSVPRAFIKESFYEQGNWCVVLTKLDI